MKLADRKGFEGRRKEAAGRSMLRGIGISNTIEFAADPTIETAEIRFDPLGGTTFVTVSISHGQGHATVQTQLVDRLGVDPEQVKFIQGDTDAVAFGKGTSRSTTMSGGAIVMVGEKIVAKGKKLAAHIPEAAEDDIEFNDGRSPSPAPITESAVTYWLSVRRRIFYSPVSSGFPATPATDCSRRRSPPRFATRWIFYAGARTARAAMGLHGRLAHRAEAHGREPCRARPQPADKRESRHPTSTICT
jgi:CO/xanthine dehydrogenase Mo-binding subunit